MSQKTFNSLIEQLDMSEASLARELGCDPKTLADYRIGRTEPKKHMIMALRWLVQQKKEAAKK